ncbi:hypothetical protein PGT21_000077 [Puccinia graminis f. sp. tritici]|uniref:Uncharacterized protein n=1 Tax=Puccinia graminis f. sp. tritici TaxID=56615 RepID=A0A5B0MP39_PUCGR|nr:hypothetical protein PGT21_000077 [Puccinia graminis f. sp. tritici]
MPRASSGRYEPTFARKSPFGSGSRSSRRGGGHSRNIPTSPEAAARIRTSHSNVEAFHSKAGLTMAHKSRFPGLQQEIPTSHSSVEASRIRVSPTLAHKLKSQFPGLQYQILTSPSTAAACHIRACLNCAGRIPRPTLHIPGPPLLQETDSGRGQGLNETQALNQKSSVDPLALPLTASPPARPAETSLTQAAVPIFGSSKLRTLKLERKNRRKGPLQGIKTALKRFLRVPKRD